MITDNVIGMLREAGAEREIEGPHVEQVADLAVDLFDRFSGPCGLVERDRELVMAAALLHDIAYAAGSSGHEEAGAEWVRTHPLEGFSEAERQVISAAILLHAPGSTDRTAGHPLMKKLDACSQTRALRLGAIVRTADGLDHSHLQDARILSSNSGPGYDEIRIECGWYERTIERTRKKASLWEPAFGRALQVDGHLAPSKNLFDEVVRAGDSTPTALRRILISQYLILRDRLPELEQGNAETALHAARVALRRMRCALGLLRGVVDGPEVKRMRRDVSTLCRELGPLRDLHVLSRGLADAGIRGPVKEEIDARIQQAEEDVRLRVASGEPREILKRMTRLLRVDLPRIERDLESPLFDEWIDKRVRLQQKKIRGVDVIRLHARPEGAHTLRKQIRRARYLAEFAAPACGDSMRKTAQRLKKSATHLGDLRDAQRLVQTLRDATTSP